MSCEKVLVVAGEASGDQHAAALVTHLKRLKPGLCVYAVGEGRLAQAGAEILVRSSDLSVVGVVEVLNHIRPILAAYKKVINWLKANRPSLLVLVDFPEFNLLVARRAKALEIPVFYYISPQIWAWRQGRVRKIRKYVDRMAVILPFERAFYRRHGMEVDFVGHPLLDSVKIGTTKRQFFLDHSIPADRKLVCLLPGSRAGEIKRHLALFLETASLIVKKAPGTSFCVPIAPGLERKALAFLQRGVDRASSPKMDIRLVKEAAHDAMAASDLVIAASGTVTLEAAIIGVPMIVTYKVSPFTYLLGKKLIKVKWVSLVNLIADREVVPELLQDMATPDSLSQKALMLLKDQQARSKMIGDLEDTVQLLGEPGAAKRAAMVAASML